MAAAAVKNDERSNTLMMTTPDKLRADAAKLDVFLEMFESTYFYFLDMAEGEAEKRDRGAWPSTRSRTEFTR